MYCIFNGFVETLNRELTWESIYFIVVTRFAISIRCWLLLVLETLVVVVCLLLLAFCVEYLLSREFGWITVKSVIFCFLNQLHSSKPPIFVKSPDFVSLGIVVL